jgi:hypothetical protein
VARKRKQKIIGLDSMSDEQLTQLHVYLVDQIHDMEFEEDWMESEGENIIPLLRGLVKFLESEYVKTSERTEDPDDEDDGDDLHEVFDEEDDSDDDE